MNITDRQILWKRKHLFVPFTQFKLGTNTGVTPTAYVASSAYYALVLTATGTATEGVVKAPEDANPSFPLGVKILWGKLASGAPTDLTWVMLLDMIPEFTIPIAAAAGALDTIIGSRVLGSLATAGGLMWSGRGIKNANWATRAQVLNGLLWQFSVNLTVAASIDGSHQIAMFGAMFDYMPMKTRFPHSEIDGPVDDASP
jgi:hypothetical protein